MNRNLRRPHNRPRGAFLLRPACLLSGTGGLKKGVLTVPSPRLYRVRAPGTSAPGSSSCRGRYGGRWASYLTLCRCPCWTAGLSARRKPCEAACRRQPPAIETTAAFALPSLRARSHGQYTSQDSAPSPARCFHACVPCCVGACARFSHHYALPYFNQKSGNPRLAPPLASVAFDVAGEPRCRYEKNQWPTKC